MTTSYARKLNLKIEGLTNLLHTTRLDLTSAFDRIRELEKPIRMLLNCPACHERHADVGEFATKPHRTHACQHCGLVWRPAIEHTVGVQFLPGYKDKC